MLATANVSCSHPSVSYSEDKLVQETTANYLRDQMGWDSIYAHNNETFGPQGTLGRNNELVELPPNKRVRTGSAPQEFIDLKTAGLTEGIPLGALALLTKIAIAGRTALAEAQRSATA